MPYMYNDLMKNQFSHSVRSFTTKMQNKGELKLKILDNIYKYYIKIHGTVSEFTKKKLTLGRIYCKIGQTTQNQKGVHMKLVKSGFWNDVTVMFNVQLFVVK